MSGDLTEERIIQEAGLIPTMARDGGKPITFITSTRKYAFGTVQKEIDKADKTGLIIKHWNVIDVKQSCPPERYKHGKTRPKLYANKDRFETITEAQYEELNSIDKAKFEGFSGYQGCVKCPLAAVCRGRLATEQKSKSPILKNISDTISAFKNSSIELARAQLMCLKPSSEGLIYPNFARSVHLITANEMYEKVIGEKPTKDMTKEDLIKFFKDQQMSFYTGMDHGYTHPYAIVTGALFGHRLFIIDSLAITGIELKQRVELTKKRIGHLDPIVYPDPAYPADNATFRRSGFKIKNFVKDVLGGIESVRHKLYPGPGSDPEIYFLKNDDGIDGLAYQLERYHWKVDSMGNSTELPDKVEDDSADALRYLCQNLFPKMGSISKGKPNMQIGYKPNWMEDEIRKHATDTAVDQSTPGFKGRKGFRFKF